MNMVYKCKVEGNKDVCLQWVKGEHKDLPEINTCAICGSPP